MLKELFEKVLKEYKTARNENFTRNPIANILRNEIPTELKKIIGNTDKYKVSGSAGQGNWTYSPWVAIMDRKITETPQSGYYLVYLFREDMKGFYLSLNQGMTEIRNQRGDNETKELLKVKAREYRENLGNVFSNYWENIDLAVESSPAAPFYEAGNIYAKYYEIKNMPSDEKLQSDLKDILELYGALGENKSKLRIIEDSIKIQDSQRKFLNIFYELSDEVITTNLGFPGGHMSGKPHWSNDLGIWISYEDLDTRYWHAFGIEKPEGSSISITCEINFPKNGIRRNIAGAFAEDESGNIYVIHRGKLGGNFSKKDFDENYDGDWTNIQDGNKETDVVVLGAIDDPDFPNKVRNFVLEVDRIKKLTINGSLEKKLENISDTLDQDIDFEDIDFGRAHIVRDIIYLITKNDEMNSEEIFQLLRNNVGDNLEYWKAYYQNSKIKNKLQFNLNSARTLKLIDKEEFKLTELGEELASNVSNWELFNYEYSPEIKKFFFGLATQNSVINQAMKILKDKGRMLFGGSKCGSSGRVTWSIWQEDEDDEIKCHQDKYPECKNCNRDPSKHISEISLYNETYIQTKLFPVGLFFWMHSRVTPMHIEGNKPFYGSNYVIWDKKTEEELENEIIQKFKSFTEFLSAKGFYFEPETIENFLLSLKAKPFVILTGNSGTGKTKIAQLFCQYLALMKGECHKIVPVGANWTENRHIIGFYNVITNEYMKSDALELILEAKKPGNIDKPFFLILDEMNLSHVERYFADFLSAMESKEKISLHKSKYEYKKSENEGVPNSTLIPENLFVIGTVNVDETTYMFSPKVLDRANVIEFSTIPVKNYMEDGLDQDELEGDFEYLENPLSNHNSDLNLRNTRINDLREYLKEVKTQEGRNLWNVLSEELYKFQEVLKKAGFDFGFRVIDEILRFMYVSWSYEGEPEIWENWERYFDAQIKQKMLPKVHGSQRTLEPVIKELYEFCCNEKSEKAPRNYGDISLNDNITYPTSALKLQEMDKVLYEQRYVAFIN